MPFWRFFKIFYYFPPIVKFIFAFFKEKAFSKNYLTILKKKYIQSLLAAIKAGEEVLRIYENEDFQIESKQDNSPLTIADKAANKIINEYLVSTGIPIISEENKQTDYEIRKNWQQCWIVDPLDGTKEFIKQNGEFTVNIALIENQQPIFGVIYVPVTGELYVGDVEVNSAKKCIVRSSEELEEKLSGAQKLTPATSKEKIRIVGSRSHMNDATVAYIEDLRAEYKKEVEMVAKGSSLKFCIVAEGEADVYPRFAPTMEWDTAAGQAICKAVGLKVIDKRTGEEMLYNREDLLNSYFLVSNFG